MAKRKNVDRIARSIEYVGTLDTTFSGSRNGITPVFLWYAIKRWGMDGFRKMLRHCMEMTEYALEQFKAHGWTAWRNEFSTESLLIKLKDEPGTLAKAAKRFKDANINIRGIHIVHQDSGYSIAAISTERTQEAMTLVQDILVKPSHP